MVKFSEQYEESQVPSWKQNYIDLENFMDKLGELDTLVKEKQAHMLPGLYYYSAQLQKSVCLLIEIKEQKVDSSEPEFRKTPRKDTRSESFQKDYEIEEGLTLTVTAKILNSNGLDNETKLKLRETLDRVHVLYHENDEFIDKEENEDEN